MKPAQKDAWMPSYLTTTGMGYREQFFGSYVGHFCLKSIYNEITYESDWAKLTDTIWPSEIISFKSI